MQHSLQVGSHLLRDDDMLAMQTMKAAILFAFEQQHSQRIKRNFPSKDPHDPKPRPQGLIAMEIHYRWASGGWADDIVKALAAATPSTDTLLLWKVLQNESGGIVTLNDKFNCIREFFIEVFRWSVYPPCVYLGRWFVQVGSYVDRRGAMRSCP